MSGDLEDFLRRAAQRRQNKAAQQPPEGAAQRSAARPKPQYSDSRTERRPRPPLDEDVVVAEVVEDVDAQWRGRAQKVEQAKRAAKLAQAEAAKELSKLKKKKSTSRIPPLEPLAPVGTGHAIEDLLNMLHRPGGIQQAVLLREILERPEHRW
ncbi:hypothetical protein [Novipirellula artificiosorum]|uniref:Uncharacterized protein n=1 Tax=Novipirellula artificiosorum TaxID=2528016 RepID=A0A5C6DCN6_9BACT|nr:hypothetical protein [Novipirellula artificiosorum]TWU32976.1 hypothetical protein Poly41_53550 [Novipirellula artificiosorum]